MRSLIRLWQSQNLRSNGLTTGGNLSLPPGSDPGRGHGGSMPPDFDVSHVKTEPDGSSLPHSQSLGGSGSRQGFGPDMSDTGVGFQSPGNPIESSVSNTFQFGALLSSQGPGGKGPVLLNMLSEQTPNTKKQRKRNNKDGLWRSPKRKQSEECEIILESSSSDSTPLGTPTSRDAPMETSLDCEEEKTGSDFGEEEIVPVEEVEEMIVRKPKKEKKTSPPTIILDLAESKNLVAPSVSITPITSSSSSFNSVLTGMGLERRPGIEIIPIVSTPATSLHTSITITPISSKVVATDDRNNRDRKSGKSRTEDKMRPEKKRNKRKREDSPSGCGGSGIAMGPPDKLPPKQDPLSKPVSVSIKPTESPPVSSVRPSSPASALRKITSSPTHVSLCMTKSSSSKPSSHQSPKHSPGYTTSSPKHHGTSSPKHQSSGGSGKPSMSALKSAASSPSTAGKSGSDVPKVKSSSSKDKDRKVSSSFSGGSSGSGSSPKLKSSSVKLKQLDMTSGCGDGGTGPQGGAGTPPLVTIDGSKSSAVPQVRNRKGSLSAVIDKLKSAQHQGPEPGEVVKEGRGSGTNPSSKTPGDTSGGIVSSSSSSKNPGEYMVKSSSEGIKITINKTRTKDSKSGVVKTSSSSTGSGSPKTHTGLKPGVNSGPASKKPHQMLQQKSTSGNSSSGISSSSSKASSGNPSSKIPSTTKSTSSPVSGILSKSTSKSSGSPKMSNLADTSRRDNKTRPPKTGSDRDKSVFSKAPDARKSSPIGLRDELEGERPLKLVTAHAKIEPSLPPQLVVEGMIKSLDTKFQIPKLSARSSNLNDGDSKKQSTDKTPVGGAESSNRMDSGAKPIDLVGKGDGSNTSTKFPSLSKTDDLKGSKIPALASVAPAIVISSLTTPTLKPPPTTTFPSVSSKLQDINLDTCTQISAPTPAPVVTSLSSSSSELSSGETEVSRIKPDLSRSGQSSGNNAKEETTVQIIGKLENPAKSFSASNNTDPSVLSALHTSKSLDSSQTKFSSSSSQKQADDSKKLVNLSDISSKSTGLNKVTPAPTTSQEAAEILLDMSASSSLPNKPLGVEPQAGKLATVPERAVAVSAPSRRNTPPPPLPPPQPSVQVHIVQSPAAAPTTASPMVITSPHSASPCSIDDELMDEALVGMGK